MSRITMEEIEYENNVCRIKWHKCYCRQCNYCFDDNINLLDEDWDWEDEEINCPKCNVFNILQ